MMFHKTQKFPIWAKAKDGKYYRIPYDQMTVFPDGKRGVDVFYKPAWGEELTDFFMRFSNYFEPRGSRYIFLGYRCPTHPLKLSMFVFFAMSAAYMGTIPIMGFSRTVTAIYTAASIGNLLIGIYRNHMRQD